MTKILRCPECMEEMTFIEIDENELVTCACCGTALEFHSGKLVISELEGEDFGE